MVRGSRSAAFALCLTAVVALQGRAREGGADGILFPHSVHAENEIECDVCHDAVTTALRWSQHLLPRMETCADCHDVDAPDECSTCHEDAAQPATYARVPPPARRFPHSRHLGAGMGCGDCHEGEAPAEPVLPRMSDCRRCHPTTPSRSDCALCHEPEESLVPADHTPNWDFLHGEAAGWEAESCGSCHLQSDCQDCHGGDNVRPRSHRLGFAFDHALEARGSESLCATCHVDASFCGSCHAAEGVLPRDHSRADWLLSGSGGRHADAARFELESCVACHEAGAEAPTCARCHGR